MFALGLEIKSTYCLISHEEGKDKVTAFSCKLFERELCWTCKQQSGYIAQGWTCGMVVLQMEEVFRTRACVSERRLTKCDLIAFNKLMQSINTFSLYACQLFNDLWLFRENYDWENTFLFHYSKWWPKLVTYRMNNLFIKRTLTHICQGFSTARCDRFLSRHRAVNLLCWSCSFIQM